MDRIVNDSERIAVFAGNEVCVYIYIINFDVLGNVSTRKKKSVEETCK